jgi:hypothetical protein
MNQMTLNDIHDDSSDLEADPSEAIEEYRLAKIGVKIAPFIPDDIDIGDCFIYLAGSSRRRYLSCGVLTGYKVYPKTIRIYYKNSYGGTRYFVSQVKKGIIPLEIIKINNIAFMLEDDRMRTLYARYIEINEKLGENKSV